MKKPVITLLCALCVTAGAWAQEKPREVVVHDNVVSPSKNETYRAAIRKLKEHCRQNKVRMRWSTTMMDDNSYVHLLPTEGAAAYKMDHFAELKTKIGKDAFDALRAELDDGIESQVERLLVAMPNHNYRRPVSGELYRMILRVIPLEGQLQAMEDLFLEWQKAYASKNSTENFSIYRIRTGDEQSYSIVFTAKDPADMERKRNESAQLLGDAGHELWNKQLALTKKYYWRRGWMMPELSYAYEEDSAER